MSDWTYMPGQEVREDEELEEQLAKEEAQEEKRQV
jgi:hypothetical protein